MAMTVGQAKSIVASIDKTLTTPEILTERVESSFGKLDTDKSGFLETAEAKRLVADLCELMHFPAPSEDEFTAHFKALDADRDGKLSCNEVGSGIVGALQHKASSLRHFLSFAERDSLEDDAELPRE